VLSSDFRVVLVIAIVILIRVGFRQGWWSGLGPWTARQLRKVVSLVFRRFFALCLFTTRLFLAVCFMLAWLVFAFCCSAIRRLLWPVVSSALRYFVGLCSSASHRFFTICLRVGGMLVSLSSSTAQRVFFVISSPDRQKTFTRLLLPTARSFFALCSSAADRLTFLIVRATQHLASTAEYFIDLFPPRVLRILAFFLRIAQYLCLICSSTTRWLFTLLGRGRQWSGCPV